MTDLLTPKDVRAMLKEFEGELAVVISPDAFNGLCRDYLTLWDRNKELEKARDQWKANHDCQVEFKRRLHARLEGVLTAIRYMGMELGEEDD